MYGFIRDVLAEKGFQVHTVPVGASVREAVRRMCEAGIGSLLVTRLNAPVGIFTERDALTRVFDAGVDIDHTAVGDAMTAAMLTVTSAMPVDEAMELMTNSRCRHLPVIDGSALSGIVSIGDLMRWVLIQQQEDLQHMTDYITGRA